MIFITCTHFCINENSYFTSFFLNCESPEDSKVRIPSNIQVLGDSGYQGIKDIHVNSRTPVKKPKGKNLTKRQKLYNHLLSKKRIVVENIIRRCKIFRITKDVYRGKHKNHGKVWNLIAGLVNLRYGDSMI